MDKKYVPLAIFLLALALRLCYLGEISGSLYAKNLVLDAEEYDRLSDQLLQGNWVLDNPSSYVHGPLYTYFIALLKLCGFHYWGQRLVQLILSALSCVLVFRIASHLFPRPIPLIGGALAAIYWPFIFYSGELLATTLTIFLEMLLVAFLLYCKDKISWRTIVITALLTTLLVTTRSNTLLFFPVVLWWIYRCSDTPQKKWRFAALFTLSVLLFLSPFLLRNQLVQGTLLPFQGSWSLYMGTNPNADGTPYTRQGLAWQRLESLPYHQGHTTPEARGRFFRAASLEFILNHSGDYLYLLYRKFRLFWHAFEIPVSSDLRYYEQHSLISRILVLNFGVLVPLGLAGLFWGRRQEPEFVLLYGFILAYLATCLIFTVCARYRLPALPFLIVFAAQGIWQLGNWIRLKKFAATVPFLILLSGTAILAHTGVDKTRVDHLRSSWLQGQVQFRTGDYKQAEQAFAARLREDPQDSDALNSLAATYSRQGRIRRAEAIYKKSLEAAPEHARPWLNLGGLYLQQQRFDEARTALETALRHDPRPVTQGEGHRQLAHLHLLRQDYQQAYQNFKQALAIREHPGAYYGLSAACAQLQLEREQRAALERAVALDPTFAPALRNLGALYIQEGNLASAEHTLQQALRSAPNVAAVHQHLGTLYLKRGQTERARQAFATAEKLASRSTPAP